LPATTNTGLGFGEQPEEHDLLVEVVADVTRGEERFRALVAEEPDQLA
jgi:hypothetical protein